MLANSTKSQTNPKVLSILERASSKGSEKTNLSTISQKLSQSAQNKQNSFSYSQTFSSQEQQNYIPTQVDSQKYVFGQSFATQRTMSFPDQMKTQYNPYMAHNDVRSSLVPFSAEVNTNFQTSDSTIMEINNGSIRNQQIIQNQFGNIPQKLQRYTTNNMISQLDLESNFNIHQSYSMVPCKSGARNIGSKLNTQESSEECIMDDLGSQLIDALNTLKFDLKEEIQKCSSIGEAQDIIMRKFNSFDQSLRQILEAYEQFEAQIKAIETVFTQQVERVLQAFEASSTKIGNLEKAVARRIDLNKEGMLRFLLRMDIDSVKKSVAKEMQLKKYPRKKMKLIPDYKKVSKPIPSFATSHHYNTRNSVLLETTKCRNELNPNSRMDVEEIISEKPKLGIIKGEKVVQERKIHKRGVNNPNIEQESPMVFIEKKIRWKN